MALASKHGRSSCRASAPFFLCIAVICSRFEKVSCLGVCNVVMLNLTALLMHKLVACRKEGSLMLSSEFPHAMRGSTGLSCCASLSRVVLITGICMLGQGRRQKSGAGAASNACVEPCMLRAMHTGRCWLCSRCIPESNHCCAYDQLERSLSE